MSALALLAIAAAGVALLLVAVIKFKIPAFLALLVVSVLVALVAGIPLPDIVKTVTEGMGGTLGSVAILVGLGAMLGKMIEVSGGAQALAGKFTQLLAPAPGHRSPHLGGVPAGHPGLLRRRVHHPDPHHLRLLQSRRGQPGQDRPAGRSASCSPSTWSSRRTPASLRGAGILNADIGWTTIIGLLTCIPVGVLGYFVAKRLNRRDYPMLSGTAEQFRLFGTGKSDVEQDTTAGGGVAVKTTAKTAPSPAMIITLIVLPILMIMVGTVGAVVLPKGSTAADIAAFVGAPLIALLTALGLAYYFLGIRRGWSSQHTGEVMDSALAPTAIVILVTGAGGVFGKVLTVSGIGTALAEGLQSIGLPLILMAFILAAVLRASQGSATVAIITTSGLLAASVADGGYTPVQTALILVAIGFGALGLSHINDSGFWIVTRYLGLSVADGLRTWTVLTTILGLAGFALTFVAWILVGGLSA